MNKKWLIIAAIVLVIIIIIVVWYNGKSKELAGQALVASVQNAPQNVANLKTDLNELKLAQSLFSGGTNAGVGRSGIYIMTEPQKIKYWRYEFGGTKVNDGISFNSSQDFETARLKVYNYYTQKISETERKISELESILK